MKSQRIIKTINVCYDAKGNIKCGTSYDDWCKTCPNKEERRILKLVEDTENE